MIYKQKEKRIRGGLIQLREWVSYNNGIIWEQNTIASLPKVSDRELDLTDKGYPKFNNKKLGMLMEDDKEYIKHLLFQSKLPKKYKLAIIRIIIKQEHEVTSKTYNTSFFQKSAQAKEFAMEKGITL